MDRRRQTDRQKILWHQYFGMQLIDYLEEVETINSENYCNLLKQPNEKIREKRPGLVKKKIIFHQ